MALLRFGFVCLALQIAIPANAAFMVWPTGPNGVPITDIGNLSLGGAHVVGQDADGKAVVWQPGIGAHELGMVPGYGLATFGSGVSLDGNVVVGTVGTTNTSFRWTSQTGMAGIPHFRASGVSGDGATVFGRDDHSLAAIWTESSGLQLLRRLDSGQTLFGYTSDATPDGRVVVGFTFDHDVFVWRAGEGARLLPSLEPRPLDVASATAVSDDGATIVGTARTEEGSTIVRWTDEGEVEPLGYLADATYIQASAASADCSTIVGGVLGGRGVIWHAELGLQYLDEVLITHYGMGPQLDGQAVLTAPTSISPDGRVIAGKVSPIGPAWVIYLDITPGDGNADGRVTGADFTLWADGFGQTGVGTAGGDFNLDGIVSGADFTLWADSFGSQSLAVPEPTDLRVPLMISAAFLGFRRTALYACVKCVLSDGRHSSLG